MSVLLKLSKSSKKRFENNSVVITQKPVKAYCFLFKVIPQKSTAYAVCEKKWLNG